MATETVINRPAPFVEEIGKKLSEQALGLQQVPVVTTGITGISKQPGETTAGFQARQDAARAFETRQQNLAGLAPQIAGLSDREKKARELADKGIGSFQPFLTSAQQLTGAGAGTAAGSVQEFMSPYQSQVIDASLAEFDRQAAQRRQQVRDQSVAAGAFGGGREAAMLGEYQAAGDIQRALAEAQIRQQGFQQARQDSLQDLQAQQGLAGFQSQLGAQQRGLAQAGLTADQQQAREVALEPFTRLGLVAPQLASVIGGFPAQTTQTTTPPPSFGQQILGLGIGAAGLTGAAKGFGKLFG